MKANKTSKCGRCSTTIKLGQEIEAYEYESMSGPARRWRHSDCPPRIVVFEVHGGQNLVLETVAGLVPAGYEDLTAYRELHERALARAQELGGLLRVRHHAHFFDDAHGSFPCRETADGEAVLVETPIGTFRLAARRARRGELKSAVTVTATATGFGSRASEDQASLPVRADGRLNAPSGASAWTWQPSAFEYADGTSSDFLGSYPRDIEWIEGPKWQDGPTRPRPPHDAPFKLYYPEHGDEPPPCVVALAKEAGIEL